MLTRLESRTARRLAWAAWGLMLALTAVGLGLLTLSYRTPVAIDWGFRGYGALLAVAYGTVGAVIAVRRPAHRIGWLFCVAGLLASLQDIGSEYAVVALLTWPGRLPGGLLAAWLASWIWVPMIGLMISFLLLLFPTGRLLSPRWRPAAWLSAAWITLLSGLFAFQPGPLWNFAAANNPFGLEADALFDLLSTVMTVLASASGFLAALSVLLRFRRSQGDERQQLKWFAYAAALLALFVPLSIAGLALPLVFATQVGLPVAVGIALLKYRLYDIDLLIRRTLAYGALTVALAVIYFGLVVGLQTLFGGLIQTGSQFTIIISTLAIAALFQPLRRRIQDFIDRRFYRRKYDAERVLAAFSATLRDEVDLDRLSAALLAVVNETMQPAQISSWLLDDPPLHKPN